MKVLEAPEITRALRTGYPAQIKPVPTADPANIVNDDEFAHIVASRLKKEAKQNA